MSLENSKENCEQIEKNSKNGTTSDWDRRGQQCTCFRKEKSEARQVDCGLAKADADFMQKALGVPVSCNNIINSVDTIKDKDGNEVFKISFEQKGGGDYDYQNKATVTDDDGGIVLRSMVNEAFSNSKDLFESKAYSETSDSPDSFIAEQKTIKSKMALPAITDRSKLALFKRALDSNISFYEKNILPPNEGTPEQILFRQDYIKVVRAIKEKLSKPESRGLTFYDLKMLGKQQEILATRGGVESSYEVGGPSCGIAKSFPFGEHLPRTRCTPPLNPIGFPFNSLDFTNGRFKEINKDGDFKCTHYVTEFNNYKQESKGTPASTVIQK